MRKPLEPPDSHHLLAAEGWLELGDSHAAAEELENIAPALHVHPAVLEIRWLISATEGKWAVCLELATAMTERIPKAPFGWIHRSFALHELKRTEEARDNLLDVIANFPDDATLRYNLACYESQLGHLNLALAYLEKAKKPVNSVISLPAE